MQAHLYKIGIDYDEISEKRSFNYLKDLMKCPEGLNFLVRLKSFLKCTVNYFSLSKKSLNRGGMSNEAQLSR